MRRDAGAGTPLPRCWNPPSAHALAEPPPHVPQPCSTAGHRSLVFAGVRRALLMPPRSTAGELVATATWPGNQISTSPQPRGRTVLPQRPHLCHKEPAAAGACGERKSGVSGCPHPVTARPATTSRPWHWHQQPAPSGAGGTRQHTEVLASTRRARRGGRDPLLGATGGGEAAPRELPRAVGTRCRRSHRATPSVTRGHRAGDGPRRDRHQGCRVGAPQPLRPPQTPLPVLSVLPSVWGPPVPVSPVPWPPVLPSLSVPVPQDPQ